VIPSRRYARWSDGHERIRLAAEGAASTTNCGGSAGSASPRIDRVAAYVRSTCPRSALWLLFVTSVDIAIAGVRHGPERR